MDDGALLCVRLRDPVTREVRTYVPGGEVEPSETPARAAARETREETGYDVTVDVGSEIVVRYPFVWAGHSVDCTTHFFRAALATRRHAPAPVQDDPIHQGVLWLPLDQLDLEIGFHATILGAVRSLVS